MRQPHESGPGSESSTGAIAARRSCQICDLEPDDEVKDPFMSFIPSTLFSDPSCDLIPSCRVFVLLRRVAYLKLCTRLYSALFGRSEISPSHSPRFPCLESVGRKLGESTVKRDRIAKLNEL